MSTWPHARLDDCCEIISGATPSTSEPSYWDGDICWATPKDLSELDGAAYISDTPRKLTQSGLASCAATLLPTESVLFSSRAPIGHIAINTVPMATNQGFKSFIPKADRVYAKFLYHWLRENRPYLESLGNGATFKEVSKAIVSRIEIPVPPLPEQRRIAEILDKAEALRAKRRAALALLDTLTQSIFLDMFGDPATNPKGWPKVQLSTMLKGADVFVDGDWVESKDQDPEGQVRLIQLADVGDGTYLNKSARFLTRQTAVRLRCTPLKVGDILVARMPDPLGRACIFPGDEREAVTVVDVCIIRPSGHNPDPVWLMGCINALGFRRMIARHATGTTRERISRGNFAKLQIISPPIVLQRDFSRRYGLAAELNAAHRDSLGELAALFASLQHRAFRGKL